ncbi:MAG: hypothetical protein ABI851_01485 [Saprospiraceae bacterium]
MKISICLILPLIFLRCNPDNCPREFEIPVNLSPSNSTFRIGDTIKLFSKFSKFLHEIKLNENYNFEKTIIDLGIQCFKIDTLNNSRQSVIGRNIKFLISDSIDLSLDDAGVSGGKLLHGRFNFIVDSFFTMANLIPVIPGIYCIWFGSANYDQKFPGQCSWNDVYDIHSKMNGGGKNNVDFLKEATDSFYINWMLADSITRFHNFGGYCIKVVL